MAHAKVILLWFTSHILLLKADSKCQPSFPCRNFSLQFPFTDVKDRECGLFPVHDCDSGYGHPKVHIGTGDSPRSMLYILGRNSEDKLLVHDFILQTLLNNGSCLALPDMSLINTPSVSFTFSPNFTVFECLKQKQSESEGTAEYATKECGPVTVYYTTPTTWDSRSAPYGCAATQLPKSGHDSGDGSHRKLATFFLIGCVTAAAFATTSIFLILFIIKLYAHPALFGFEKTKSRNEKEIELFLKNNGNLAPLRYKYSDIEKMTNSFTQNLGRGGYGSVHKGKLPDGHPVAVKILDESKGNGEEFMNEVASISRTSHVNIVSLLGFCFEGCKRVLIYEFMPNGSLEKFISNATQGGLGWQKLFEIAVGIARGLDYLHQGCKTRILHLDIKPHNILLDKDFNPRISDFGLARLCPNRSSIVSVMGTRGTIGYIAPEVFCRNFGEVSHKSDVYSYGMMVLEIAGGKKNIDRADVDCTSEAYFPDYIYKLLEMDGNEVDTLVEMPNEDENQFAKRKLIIVGLWCIQTDPKDWPSMSKVIDMLEGKVESLCVPPKPKLSSPPRSGPKFSTFGSVL